MALTISGEVTRILEEESGSGRGGPWRKRAFILQVPGDYPREIHVIQWGDNIDKSPVKIGETITAHIDLQSREYNGRWYTDVKAWKIERAETGSKGSKRPPRGEEPPPPDEPPEGLDEEDDALPF